MVERALLIGVYFDKSEEGEAESLLEELGELVRTLGIGIVDSLLVKVRGRHAGTLMGKGKMAEIVEHAKDFNCDCVIFDNELTPSQQRNWEAEVDVLVIDRHEVILDIFSMRAQTKEARLQVQLARMEYSLPRLARMWGHLDRQGGGSGGGKGGAAAARGEGEKQIEVDRRLARKSIDKVKEELAQVRKQRDTQRKERTRVPVPHAAIVGYTNAGKSSLLNRLSDSEVLAEDKLFATLDTTTRRITLPDAQPLLLTDTVGFVRRLPHGLVESFKATLEEAIIAGNGPRYVVKIGLRKRRTVGTPRHNGFVHDTGPFSNGRELGGPGGSNDDRTFGKMLVKDHLGLTGHVQVIGIGVQDFK